MMLSPVWIVPLVAGGVGALVLAVVAAVVRRDVDELQKAMRPLRVPSGKGRNGRTRAR